MHQRKSKKILVYFFLLIIVSSISNNSFNNLKINQIQNINISGLDQKDNEIAQLKQKAETDKAKATQKSTDKMVNPEKPTVPIKKR